MDIQNITVVGAGNMGSGIAQSFAQSGFKVRVHDISAEAIERGLSRLRGPLEKRVAAGKMAQDALDAIFANLVPTPDFDEACDADLVIEAVFEDLGVKQDLFARLDKACPERTILATNTSSFTVEDMASVTGRADRVVGYHFFFPANINKLLEVVRGPSTSDDVFDAAFSAAKRAGKIPIETADAPGFCVNRFFVPWINESCRLVDEGFSVATIEAAAKQAFNIGMGPFQLMNVTGVPISLHAQSTLFERLGAFYEPAAALRAQVEKGENWDLEGTPDESQFAAVASRLRGVAFGVACHLVEEGVATIMDTDRGATIGLRWASGPFAMMNEDMASARADVQALHDTWGDAFPMPAFSDAWHIPSVTLTWPAKHVALLTFCRPEAMNALNDKVLTDLDACLDECDDARAIVLTGEGKAFIAGADIPTMKALDTMGATTYTELGHRVLNRLSGHDAPVLMAINGFAFGGGLELALCGDLLYASDKAQLGLPEVGLGIHPGFGGTQRLPRRVGLGVAKDLVLTGRTVGPDEAQKLGLVNAVFGHQELMERVIGIAKDLATKAPLAVAGAKRVLDAGFGMDITQALKTEQESVVLLFDTKDKEEGLAAFMERRKPTFTGA